MNIFHTTPWVDLKNFHFLFDIISNNVLNVLHDVKPDVILNVLLYVTIDVIPDAIPDVIITVIIDAIPDAIPDINIDVIFDVLHILYTRFREKWFLELLF